MRRTARDCSRHRGQGKIDAALLGSRQRTVKKFDASPEDLWAVIEGIGGQHGWYSWSLGWHVRGILDRIGNNRQGAESASVRSELQADCFAGVWANRSDERWHLLQPGDVEAALRTAAAIGDDTLQRRSQGRVVPDSFTHGSAAQRKQWFMTGYQQGNVQACNTFGAGAL